MIIRDDAGLLIEIFKLSILPPLLSVAFNFNSKLLKNFKLLYKKFI